MCLVTRTCLWHSLTLNNMPEEPYEAEYIGKALALIEHEVEWANHFPDQCHDRIRTVCELVRQRMELPKNETAR